MGFESLWLDMLDDNWLGIIVEMIIFVYCFAGLAAVCDKFLVVSLETLCVRWGIREDVAGATFMAFGSAAPEIIINAIGTITGESDLGVGAIIGSGMIAFSCIPGLCSLVAGSDLMLKRRPLARDSLMYLVALGCLVLFFRDGFITIEESSVLFGMYVFYVSLVFLSPNIRKFLQTRKKKKQYDVAVKEAMARGADRAQLEELRVRYLTEQTKKSFVEQAAERDAATKKAGPAPTNGNSNFSSALLGDVPGAGDSGGDGIGSPRSDDEDAEYVPPSHVDEDEEEDQSWKGKAYRAFTAPLTLAFSYTCIPCEHDGPNAKWYRRMTRITAHPHSSSEAVHVCVELDYSFVAELLTVSWFVVLMVRRYPLTFAVAFVWVSFFSFTISAVAGRWNELSGLPLSLFGIVLVAVGAEIPDTISSLAVARRGYGSMAISNSCGSQITNILFGLGLPWMLANVIGIGKKRVAGVNPCDEWQVENPEEKTCPDDVAHSYDKYGYSAEDGTIAWQGVQIADHSDVIIAAAFQFMILFIFITSLLLLALAQKKEKATLNKRKGIIFVCGYATAVVGYMIVSRAIVKPGTDTKIYAAEE